ncbi:MAG TPA: NUDIX domain-containing protein [Nitrososphaerales archaeon]|nr:NUDIX domain-containing protein [Nitrososphaerales archaeon]
MTEGKSGERLSIYIVDGEPEKIYTVDEKGQLLTLDFRETLHRRVTSRRHAAVIGMLQRHDNKFLVQWRAGKKLGGDRLDVSATTHVRKGETYESALQRSFENELRVTGTIPLRHVFDFTYEEELGDNKENEFCRVFFGSYDGSFEPNPDEIDRVDFMSLQQLREFIANDERKSTKWLRETVKRIDDSMV